MWGSWGPFDRRQPSREAETITQHQIQHTEMEGGGGGSRVVCVCVLGAESTDLKKVEDNKQFGCRYKQKETLRLRVGVEENVLIKRKRSWGRRRSVAERCPGVYHQPRSRRMNSDPSQPSAEAR